MHKLDDIVAVVLAAFDKLSFRTLTKILVTLKKVMKLFMKDEGFNQLNITHIKRSERINAR